VRLRVRSGLTLTGITVPAGPGQYIKAAFRIGTPERCLHDAAVRDGPPYHGRAALPRTRGPPLLRFGVPQQLGSENAIDKPRRRPCEVGSASLPITNHQPRFRRRVEQKATELNKKRHRIGLR